MEMQNAECEMQNEETHQFCMQHSAFCIEKVLDICKGVC